MFIRVHTNNIDVVVVVVKRIGFNRNALSKFYALIRCACIPSSVYNVINVMRYVLQLCFATLALILWLREIHSVM